MYYPLVRNSNNEMKALRELKKDSRSKVMPIIESKRIKKENTNNWEGTFKTLGRYLKERVKDINFIYDFNCAFEEIDADEILKTHSGENLVEHCIEKMIEHDLNLIPCFQHDSPEWMINSIIESKFDNIAIRIRCHDFQKSFDPFVFEKLKKDIKNTSQHTKFKIILDFFDHDSSLKRIRNAIDTFSQLPNSEIIYLATSCPSDASKAEVHAITLMKSREELNKYLKLKESYFY